MNLLSKLNEEKNPRFTVFKGGSSSAIKLDGWDVATITETELGFNERQLKLSEEILGITVDDN